MFTGTKRLFLLRHGETAENAAGRFLGRSDPSLSELGRQQAQQSSRALQQLGVDALVSSPAQRARETASLLELGNPIFDERFREIDFGDWEGFTQEEIALRDPVTFAAFAEGDIDGFPGGETVAEVAARTLAAVNECNSERLLVVTHATVIRILVVALLALPVNRYRSLFDRPSNLSVTELCCNNGAWSVSAYAMSANELLSIDND